MLRAGRHYLVLFLATGVPFGLIFGSIVALIEGSVAVGASIGLVTGVAFGLLVALILGTANAVSSRGSGGTRRSLGPRQAAEVVIAADLRAVGERAYAALVTLPARVTTNSDNRLEGRTGFSWRSFGEVVSVELAPHAEGTHVRVSSRPKVPTALIDYGSGRRRVDAVVDALRSPTSDCPTRG